MSANDSDHPAPATLSVASPHPENGRKSSYGQILKSSALIGGSSVLSIGVSVIRTKAMALLLGPAGFGVTGLYLSILDLARGVAAMGINTSGVRQIAAAVGSGDEEQIARTAVVLRRTSMVLGVMGALLLALLAGPIARFTFGNDQYVSGVALLALAVMFYTIGGGWDALIQGTRRIADLARINVYGASVGVVTSVAIVFMFRERGIAPALVVTAGIALSFSWWYGRKIKIRNVALTPIVVRKEAAGLLHLGMVFFASSLLMMGGAYAIRTIIMRQIGLEAAGFYQSAWALGGMYVGIVLQAMGADFYPRLTAMAGNNAECNRLVNEQMQVSLLLAGPGVLATLAFAPLVIALFYTSDFSAAVEPLRWICLGMALRVVTWPVGFIIVARGLRGIFFWTEVLATVVHVGLAWLCVKPFGVSGAGMAFLGLYLVHGCVVYLLVRHLTGFRLSASNCEVGLVVLGLMVGVFCGFLWLPFWVATVASAIALLISGVFSLRRLCRLVPLDRLPKWSRRLLAWCRLTGPLEGGA